MGLFLYLSITIVFQANVLLKIGVAEVYTEPKKAAPKAKKEDKTKE